MYIYMCFAPCSVEGDGPVSKKPRTTNVVVEQGGQNDKLLIDQVTDTDSVFEEVYTCTYTSKIHIHVYISSCVLM